MRFYISFMMTAGLHGLKVKERPDLVLATTPPIFAAVAGRYLAALKGAKFILDVRDLWPAAAIVLGQLRSSSAAKWAQKLERYLYRNADLISTTTGGFQRRITATESIAPALVVPNGTEPGLFNPALLDSSLRERLGFNGKTVVGFAGNLGIAQDLNTVIETARLLRRTGRLFFFFIGAGPREQWCRDRVRELRLRNVLFHPQVPVDRIVPYILAMDVALVTLEANPLFSLFVPSKLYDYMACRRPVVTNVAGETERIIEESNGGVVVPGGNPAALAKAIENLAGDPERMARMGKSGREYVSHHYDRNVIADSFVSRMEELADSRS